MYICDVEKNGFILYSYSVCLSVEGVLMGKCFFKKLKRENMLFKKFSLYSGKIEKVVNFLNKTSLIGHMFLAMILCLFIESCSRHSVKAAFSFMKETPFIFLYNSLIIFVTRFANIHPLIIPKKHQTSPIVTRTAIRFLNK